MANLPTGYTSVSNGGTGFASRIAYKLITATGTENVTGSGSGAQRAGALVCYQPAASGIHPAVLQYYYRMTQDDN